jgi:hypothetical protein
MTLLKSLIRKEKTTSFSYDNLVGNFRDGEIGGKVKTLIMNEFFA